MRCTPLVLLVAACKAGDTDGGNGAYGALPDAEVTFSSDGDGPANELPLEPMNTGYRGVAEGGASLRWSGPVDAGRDSVSVMEVDGPQYGYGAGLYRHTRAGVVTHGLDRHLSPTALPVLMVPDEVRVGMAWESEYGVGEFVNGQSVVSHATVMTPVGSVSAWGIGEYEGANLARVRWYGEGIGRIEAAPNTSTAWDPALGFASMVVPVDVQQHVELAFDPTALRPVLDAFGRALDPGSEPDGLVALDRDGETLLVWYGYIPAQCQYCSPTAPVTCLKPGRLPYVPAEQCPVVGPGDRSPVGLASEARRAVGLPGDGLASWWVDGVSYTLTYGNVNPPFDFFVRPAAGPPVLLDDGLSHRAAWRAGNESLYDVVFVGPLVAGAGAPVVLAAVLPDGRVFEVRVSDTRIDGFRFVGSLPGHIAIAQDGDDLIAYAVTTDGRVFRAAVEGGVARVDSLGDLTLDDTTGINVVNNVVVDPNDPTTLYATLMPYPIEGQDFNPRYGMTLLQATLVRDPVAARGPAAFGVGFGAVVGGLAVCWPPTDDPLETTGWTVQGRPAQVYGPGGPDRSCAVVVPDGQDDVRWAGAEHAIEGPLPGVGLTKIGFGGDAFGLGFDTLAGPTADGGAVDLRGVRLDGTGLQIGRWETGLSSGSINYAWTRDLAGHGLYEWTSFDAGVWSVGSDVVLPDRAAGYRFAGWVGSGGALLSSATGSWMIARPGGQEEVPAVQVTEIASWSQRLVLDDGQICGVFTGAIRCVDRSGATRELSVSASAAPFPPAFWPIGDGTFAFTPPGSPSPTQRFDPDAMTLTALDERTLQGAATASDGRAYGFARSVGDDGLPALDLVEITADGFVDRGRIGGETGREAVVPLVDQLLVLDASLVWKRVPR